MRLTVGTFNANNLFSRFNFRLDAEVPGLAEGAVELQRIEKIATDLSKLAIEYTGRAVTHKRPAAREAVAARIAAMSLDVLALQEVEDIETLRRFARDELPDGTRYPHLVLIEGNDPRLIDLAVMSKYPIGAVTTWQHATHPDQPGERVFGRDLLQVEILEQNGGDVLLTLFNNHLKSHFVPFTEDQQAGAQQANARRRRQAEVAARIIADQMRPDSRYVVLGDMNDPIDSADLAPLLQDAQLQLVNGLHAASASPQLTGTPTTPWTHRFKESGKPAHYELFDQIWLSPALAARQRGAFIARRTKLTGDGSDHDPAWVELDL